MNKINKLVSPATILIASIILGSFFYASQVSKQRSIERQQEAKIQQEKQEQLAKEVKEQEAKEQAERQARLNAINSRLSTLNLELCLDDAVVAYHANFKNECKARNLEENCSLPLQIAESLAGVEKDAKSDCFKKYPQNDLGN